ncbi:MAG: hypothetical protein QOG83_2706 [Alphaproteobacteria bacterium]|nr:hypothetical protein [Alphaproteobacteria bacterium]
MILLWFFNTYAVWSPIGVSTHWRSASHAGKGALFNGFGASKFLRTHANFWDMADRIATCQKRMFCGMAVGLPGISLGRPLPAAIEFGNIVGAARLYNENGGVALI